MKKLLYFIITLNFCIKRIFSINSEVVEKYGTKKILNPDTSGRIFFYLEINDFSKKSNIYIKIRTQERDNLDFYYGFISTISSDSQSLKGYNKIDPKTLKDEGDDRIYYFTIEKKSDSIYLAFYIQIRKGAFTSSVEFENTEKDEADKVIKDYLIGCAVLVVVVGIIVLIIYLIYRKCKSKKQNQQTLQLQNQQMNAQNQQMFYQNPQMMNPNYQIMYQNQGMNDQNQQIGNFNDIQYQKQNEKDFINKDVKINN